jgi:hypothetical protein
MDAEEATETVDRFDNHIRAVGKGIQGLRNIFGQVREARVGESSSTRISVVLMTYATQQCHRPNGCCLIRFYL